MDMTTIQIKKSTRRQLDILKDELGLSSCEAVIKKLIPRRLKIPKSLAGIYPDLKWNKKTDRMQFKTD